VICGVTHQPGEARVKSVEAFAGPRRPASSASSTRPGSGAWTTRASHTSPSKAASKLVPSILRAATPRSIAGRRVRRRASLRSCRGRATRGGPRIGGGRSRTSGIARTSWPCSPLSATNPTRSPSTWPSSGPSSPLRTAGAPWWRSSSATRRRRRCRGATGRAAPPAPARQPRPPAEDNAG